MKKLSMVLLTGVLMNSMFAVGEPKSEGQRLAVSCEACHGKSGISTAPNYPNLACQKEMYLNKQLKAFKEGSRKDAIMENFAKPLSDSDIKQLSAYYSQLPCQH